MSEAKPRLRLFIAEAYHYAGEGQLLKTGYSVCDETGKELIRDETKMGALLKALAQNSIFVYEPAKP